MGVIAETTDRVGVLYAGRLAEIGNTREVLTDPKHPYTRGLVESTPRIDSNSFQKITFSDTWINAKVRCNAKRMCFPSTMCIC